LLGPKGDSTGCISIKDYDRFLKAYDNGEFSRIVVVPRLPPERRGTLFEPEREGSRTATAN